MNRFLKNVLASLSVVTLLVVASFSAGCSNEKKATKTERPTTQSYIDAAGFEPIVSSKNLFRRTLTSASQSAKTQFSKVDNSGIDFTNKLPQNVDRLVETGAGVAIADYDGDGEVDIYLLATEGSNKLYRGLGNFKFEDVTEAAGVDGSVQGKTAWGAGASFADVDNDGDLDLFVCNMASPDLLYINQGDGTFKEDGAARGVSEGNASKIGNFCDYDLDGDLDLYVVTYKAAEDNREPKTINVENRTYIHPDFRDSFGFVHGRILESGQRDFLLRNDGNGFFEDVTTQAKVMDYATGLSMLWVDYNHDGLPDIYVANDFWQPDRLLQNRGDGTFTDELPKAAKHTTWFSKGCDSGDLNNDGLTDLFVGDVEGSSRYRRLLTKVVMEDSSWFLEVGEPRQYKRNTVFINSGAGKLMDAAHMTGMANTDCTWGTRMADLNNDGWLDVFITNGQTRDILNSDIVENLKQLRKEREFDKFEKAVKEIPPVNERNMAFENLGNLNFKNVSEAWGLDLEGISHGVALADLDHDGDLDMVVNNLDQPASIYRNDSSEGNRITISLRSQQGNTYGFGSTVEITAQGQTQSKYLSPVRGYLSSDQPILHFGLGDASTIDQLRITWPGGKVQEYENLKPGFHYLAVENEASSEPQLAKASSPKTAFVEETNAIEVTHFDGESDDFARQPLLPYRTSSLGPGVALGDINNDGLTDVFLCKGNDQPSTLLVNRGASIFEEVSGPWTKQFLQDDMAALFFDANGDGFEDLLITSGGSEYELGNEKLRDRLFINQQQETFAYSVRSLPKTETSSSTAAAFDFDRDGDLDLVIGARSIPHEYPLASRTQLLRNDNGIFVEVNWKVAKPLLKIGVVNSVLCSDFNNDQWTDLIIATELGPVHFLENREGKFHDVTADLGLAGMNGWWRGLAAGDFDSDGDIDYVATNQGRNTKYQIDAQHPWKLYFGDFDKSGRKDLIEVEYVGDTEYPARGLTRSSKAVSTVRKKFKTFEAFAKAPLADIYDFDATRTETREVNYLDSAIIWNDGDSMRVEPLPRMAQISPGFGVETLDYDCDGDIDILLANNFFGAESQTGYMDGGLGALLKNDGTGAFEFVWPNESGVALEGDSMGLATADLDLDGDRDAIVGVHSDKTRMLINQSDPEEFATLRVVGHSKNPRSIGATVLIEYQDGSKRRHELRAGGSYLSQSTNTIFLHATTEKPLTSISVKWPSGETAMLDADQLAAELGGAADLEIDVRDYTTE